MFEGAEALMGGDYYADLINTQEEPKRLDPKLFNRFTTFSGKVIETYPEKLGADWLWSKDWNTYFRRVK